MYFTSSGVCLSLEGPLKLQWGDPRNAKNGHFGQIGPKLASMAREMNQQFTRFKTKLHLILMFLNILCILHNCTNCISLIFLHNVFSNASIKRLLYWMHSHRSCTCLTFLPCGFPNDFLNCLPERKQSRTGCICMAFPQYAFSNGFLNGPTEKLYSHTGYICLTFLHCAFLSASLKHLPL